MVKNIASKTTRAKGDMTKAKVASPAAKRAELVPDKGGAPLDVVKAAKSVAKSPAKPVKKRDSPQAVQDPVTKEKVRKPKLVRGSFTMTETEYAMLGKVKKACLKAGIEVKKSELLRAGLALVLDLDTARLGKVLGALATLKAGRPEKNK